MKFVHPVYHSGCEFVQDDKERLLFVREVYRGNAFSTNVQALWLKGFGVRAAKLSVGGCLLGISRVQPDREMQRLRFTLNDVALPLHTLSVHHVWLDLFFEEEFRCTDTFWEEATWDVHNKNPHAIREMLVELDRPRGAHNMWAFANGMASPRFSEGCDTHGELLEKLSDTRKIYIKEGAPPIKMKSANYRGPAA